MKSKKLKIAVIGGGTAGHIFPLREIAQSLREEVRTLGMEPDVRYLGTAGEYEKLWLSDGVRVHRIASGKLRRYFDVRNALDVLKFLVGLAQSMWRLFWFMPHVCVSKGGPGTPAILSACRWYFIPLVIHESDTVPGLASLFAGRFARRIELGFQGAARYFADQSAVRVVGNPVRRLIRAGSERRDAAGARASFGLEPSTATLLFIGGSQGADAFNTFLLENIEVLTRHFQVLHQTGVANFAPHKQLFDVLRRDMPVELQRRYVFVPFFEENIVSAYHAADLAVIRAGANTLFEVATMGLPALVVPLPGSANNHQEENAYAFERAGAGVVIEQDNLLPEIVVSEAKRIFETEGLYQQMVAAARAFGTPDAAGAVARDTLAMLGLDVQAIQR